MSKLIVLEGIDGCGKTTQARQLHQYLTSLGIVSCLTRQPSDGPIGLLLREVIAGKHTQKSPMSADTLALLFAADRIHHCQDIVDPAITAGTVVVSDRWYHSSLAYQATIADIDKILVINERARRPDLTIFLRVDPEVSAARRAAARRSIEIFDDESTQRRVTDGYRRAIDVLSARGERIEIVDGGMTPVEVATRVLELVLSVISPSSSSCVYLEHEERDHG